MRQLPDPAQRDSLLTRFDPEALRRIMLGLHRDCDCGEPRSCAPPSRFRCEPTEEDAP